MESDGKIAYEAYLKAVGGRSLITGDVLPVWEALHGDVRGAWESAAQAVADRVLG